MSLFSAKKKTESPKPPSTEELMGILQDPGACKADQDNLAIDFLAKIGEGHSIFDVRGAITEASKVLLLKYPEATLYDAMARSNIVTWRLGLDHGYSGQFTLQRLEVIVELFPTSPVTRELAIAVFCSEKIRPDRGFEAAKNLAKKRQPPGLTREELEKFRNRLLSEQYGLISHQHGVELAAEIQTLLLQ